MSNALHELLRERMAAGARVKGPSGLPDLRRLDQAMGHPGKKAFVVQVVGTNGKGSTTSLFAHLLGKAGIRVGWFSSPHIHRVHERIRIGGECIDDESLYARCELIAVKERELGLQLTFFELLTMVALGYFEQERVEVIILEAGLGGRLDSTRVRSSDLTLVTPIALDHQDYLGPTLGHIAREKAAVIHARAPVLSALQAEEVRACLFERSKEVGTPIRMVEPLAECWIGLQADYQRQNAALALEAKRSFDGMMGREGSPACAQMFEDWHWPGRMQEVLGTQGGGVLYDVAHNPHAMQALVRSIEARRMCLDCIYLFCALDKDRAGIKAMLSTLGCPIQEIELDDAAAEQQIAGAQAQIRAGLSRGEWSLVVGSHRIVAALSSETQSDGLSDPLARRPFGAEKSALIPGE